MMRVYATGSALGVLTLLTSSVVGAAQGAGPAPFLRDSMFDALVVGALVVTGLGIMALLYRAQSTA